jgi:hypothetical protein
VDQRDRLRGELAAAKRTAAAQERAVERLTRRVEEIQENYLQLTRDTAGLVAPSDSTGSLQYLVMLTYGRSGSTLLQGVINSTPGYLMRGENRDALYHLFKYHCGLERERKEHEHTSDSTRSAWYGIDQYATEAAVTGLRNVVVPTLLRPRTDTKVIGFKEIRWWHEDWREYLTFLQDLFPGVRFVINSRRHEDVARSKWWVERQNPLEMLARYEKRLDDMAAVLGDRAYKMRYEDYIADRAVLREFFDWLGAPFDGDRIDAVMRIRHSH